VKKLELVLPCYNEEKSLHQLLIKAISAAEASGLSHEDFGLVLVENGSKDQSRAKMNELKETSLGQWFKVVSIDINKGYGNGLWQGLQQTDSEFVAWSHADQQCDPKDVFKAYSLILSKESDLRYRTLVKGTRFGRALKDKFVSAVFALFAKVILGLSCNEVNAQPKVFHRQLLGHIQNPPLNFAFDLYVLYQAQRLKFAVEEIEVLFPPRIHGLSNWSAHFLSRYKTILGMIRYMWDLMRAEGRL
jgi:glycosyltransferase involved in cell wall biosynthesis